MKRRVGLWRDRWCWRETGGPMERHVGMGERQVGLEKDRWGWGETGGVGLPSRVPAVVRMLVLPLALNEASV